MATQTAQTSQTAAHPDITVVHSGFAALGRGDLRGCGEMLPDDATWTHRNDDRFGGPHHGRDDILAYLAESMQLTAGTLRPIPRSFMAGSDGRVCVLVQVSGTRPDGRSFDNPQILPFAIDGGRVRTVDQFVADPKAVADHLSPTAFTVDHTRTMRSSRVTSPTGFTVVPVAPGSAPHGKPFAVP